MEKKENATTRLVDAPYHARAFALACWGELPNYHDGSLLPFWKFLETAVYNAAAHTIVFEGREWHVPSEEASDA